MTHAQMVAAVAASELRAPTSAEAHGCYAQRKPRPAGRPDALAAWRNTSSRSRQQRLAEGGQGGREKPAVECVVTQGGRPEVPGASTPGADRRCPGYQPATCTCGHPSGDHATIIGAGVLAEQHGRCLYCPDCTGFTETRDAA